MGVVKTAAFSVYYLMSRLQGWEYGQENCKDVTQHLMKYEQGNATEGWTLHYITFGIYIIW